MEENFTFGFQSTVGSSSACLSKYVSFLKLKWQPYKTLPQSKEYYQNPHPGLSEAIPPPPKKQPNYIYQLPGTNLQVHYCDCGNLCSKRTDRLKLKVPMK